MQVNKIPGTKPVGMIRNVRASKGSSELTGQCNNADVESKRCAEHIQAFSGPREPTSLGDDRPTPRGRHLSWARERGREKQGGSRPGHKRAARSRNERRNNPSRNGHPNRDTCRINAPRKTHSWSESLHTTWNAEEAAADSVMGTLTSQQ